MPETVTTETTTQNSNGLPATGASSSPAAATDSGGDWRASLGELANEPSLKDVPDVSTLAKRFLDTKRMVGDSIRVPKEDAPPEEWDKFNARLRPESPDKYVYQVPENLPEGLAWDTDLEKDFRQVCYETGIPQRAFSKVIDMWQGRMTKAYEGMVAEIQAEQQKTESALKGEWGAKYEANIQLAQDNAKRVFGEEGFALLRDHGILGNSAPIIRALAALGTRLGATRAEPGMVTGDRTSDSEADQAAAEIAAINSDPTHPKSPRNPKLGPKEIEANITYLNALYQKQIAARA